MPTEHVHHKNGVRDDNRLRNLELWQIAHPSGQRVRDLLLPLIEAYKAGDTEHSGMEVAATLEQFCATGEVRLDWRDEDGSLCFAELKALGV